MTTPDVPSGWYNDGSGRQRWWDGTAWGQFAEPALSETHLPATVMETPRSKPKGLAIAALIVGILAFLTGLLPVVGAVLGIVAVILGIVAVVKRQSKGMAITAIVLGAIATVVSIVMAAGFASFVANTSSSGPRSDPAPVTTSAPAEEPEGSSAPANPEPSEPAAEEPAAPDLTTFEEVDDRTWALIVKDPDAHKGKELVLYGSIMQFDSATGRCAMIVHTEATQRESSYDYDQNVFAVAGDWQTSCPVFDPLVEDDHVKMWITVLESFSYDTQIGGNTTVPMVEVLQVELLPETAY